MPNEAMLLNALKAMRDAAVYLCAASSDKRLRTVAEARLVAALEVARTAISKAERANEPAE